LKPSDTLKSGGALALVQSIYDGSLGAMKARQNATNAANIAHSAKWTQ